jgi:branched-subunit amino acid ABC-type transport system permease component
VANLGEQLLNALTLAGLLFLVSAGLSLVFGILRVVNFAHGVFYMLGAYLGYTTVVLSGWFWPALLVVPPVVGALGAFLESSTLRFIYRRPPIYQLLLTFGLALILEEGVRILYGPTAKGIDPPTSLQGAIALGSLLYPRYRLFVVGLGLAVAVAVWLFLRETRAVSSSVPSLRTARWPIASVPTSRASGRTCSAPPARSPGSAAWWRRP